MAPRMMCASTTSWLSTASSYSLRVSDCRRAESAIRSASRAKAEAGHAAASARLPPFRRASPTRASRNARTCSARTGARLPRSHSTTSLPASLASVAELPT